MIPPRSFPPGILSLAEFDGNQKLRTVAEYPTSSRNRMKLQQMRNDMLMADPKLNLQICENNA